MFLSTRLLTQESKEHLKIPSVLFYTLFLRLTHVKTVGKNVTLSSKKKIPKIHSFEFACSDIGIETSDILQWTSIKNYYLDGNSFDIEVKEIIEENKVYCFRLVCDIEHKNKSKELICSNISSMFNLWVVASFSINA